jgi:hypothetical protein
LAAFIAACPFGVRSFITALDLPRSGFLIGYRSSQFTNEVRARLEDSRCSRQNQRP